MGVNRIWNRIVRPFRREAPSEGEWRCRVRLELIGLSVIAFNSLTRSGIETVGDVLERSPAELLSVRNFGLKSFANLTERLCEHGFIDSTSVLFTLPKKVYPAREYVSRERKAELAPFVTFGEDPLDKLRREGFVAHHREIPSMIRKKQNGEA
jgi:hypothetical protein